MAEDINMTLVLDIGLQCIAVHRHAVTLRTKGQWSSLRNYQMYCRRKYSVWNCAYWYHCLCFLVRIYSILRLTALKGREESDETW